VHDLKRATGLLARFDITLEGVKDDTFLAAYLLDPNRSKYELTDLAREAIGFEDGSAPPSNWPASAWETATAADLTSQTAKVLHSRILERNSRPLFRSQLPLPHCSTGWRRWD
jgi:DNA polymerase I-like protein with 3'-5' exonuclease and polymerase domains